jgi:ribulose-phosphate 3-epimerase
MSVHPGFGGQGFIPETMDKLGAIRRKLERQGLEIDWGIKLDSIRIVA